MTTLPDPFLHYFDRQISTLCEMLSAALPQSPTSYAHLPADAQQTTIERSVIALRDALAQQHAAPLLNAVASIMPSNDDVSLSDIQVYLDLLRHCTFAVTTPFVLQDAATGVVVLDRISAVLSQAITADLEQRLTLLRQHRDTLSQQVSSQLMEVQTFVSLAENAPDGIAVVGPQGVINYANPSFRTMTGWGDQLVGLPMIECFPPEEAHRPLEIIQYVLEHGSWQGLATYQRKDRSTFQGHLSVFAIRDQDGQPLAFPGIVRDITDQLRSEQERVALQAQVIATQEAMLRELSTPIIPLADDVIVLPLIGSIDTTRAQQVLETLLEGVVVHRAAVAILDITGVPVVDTHVANALLRTAQAVKLLGTQLVLTGIRPEVAQTIVGLGLNLHDIITHATLQSGIAFALAQRGRNTLQRNLR